RDAAESGRACEELRFVADIERAVLTVDRAVRNVHGAVLHDDAGAGRDDSTGRDVELASTAHGDGIAVDENLSPVEMNPSLAFANDRFGGVAMRHAFMAFAAAARTHDAHAWA